MEMPDKIYLFPDANSIGDLGFTITYPKESWDGRDYIEYHHSRIVEELKENLAETVIALAARNTALYDCIGIPAFYGFVEPIEGYVERPQDLKYVLKEMGETIKQLNSKIQRWEDAHSEMIAEVELRRCLAELEAIIEAREM